MKLGCICFKYVENITNSYTKFANYSSQFQFFFTPKCNVDNIVLCQLTRNVTYDL
jgi:hypothetical protein